jgi:CHASE2 domain-containing sensor protein
MKYVIVILIAILSCSPKASDEIIVLINVEQLEVGRENIAKGITLLDSFAPKVIAIDLQFPDEHNNEKIDDELSRVLNDCRSSLVLCSDIDDYESNIDDYEERLEEYSGFKESTLLKLAPSKSKTGFSNLITDLDPFLTVKVFPSWEKVNGKVEYQFGVQTAILFDSLKAANFVKQHPKINSINFHMGKKFKSFGISDIINGKVRREDIEGKIVMIGFLGPGFTDRFYSGAIKRGNGSFEPDMFGVEFQAHIAMQVLLE